ncbi:MAG TPA: hypothetical protein PLA15_03550 [bacterium]|nr:hypothetical protein [bacterium]
MVNPTDRQWLDENEIIDKFVFGRLTDNESIRLNELRKNEDFNAMFDRELMTIAALRAHGRIAMKQRIRELLHTSSPLHLSHTANPAPGKVMTMRFVWRAAATVAVIAGGLWIYKMNLQPAPEVAKKQNIQNEQAPIVNTDKQAPAQTSTEPGTPSNDVAAKRTNKPNERKSMIAGQLPPSKTDRTRPAALAAVPHEVYVSISVLNATESTETRILFKNPFDLVAADIRETQEEKDGQLNWFYVYYENRIVSAYLDNSKYVARFIGTHLKEEPGVLIINTPQSKYRVDLTTKEKFKKAVRIP